MRMLFLGTASAEGYPATFCCCRNCLEARRRGGKNLRSRASLLVNDDLLIDAPPDLARRSVELGVELCKVKALLVTHSHEDHIYLDELRLRVWPFAAEPPTRLKVVCNKRVRALLRRRYKGRFRALRLTVRAVEPFESLKVARYRVTPLLASHHVEAGELPLIYLIEDRGTTLLYASDTGPLPPSTLSFLERVRLDAVITEATLGIVSSAVFPYHMGFEDVIKLKEWMESHSIITRRTPFMVTHFSHLTCPLHEEIEETLGPYGITPAYDGLTLEV